MKSYNQFVTEVTTSKENIQEIAPALALGAAGKALSYGFAGYQTYQAAKKLSKGDYGGAAMDAALAIPSAGAASRIAKGFKLGQRAVKPLTYAARGGKAGIIAKQTVDALKEPPSAEKTQPPKDNKPSTGTQPAAPKSSSVVLARKGGVMGKLDKATGKWTKGDWTEKESARYKRVAAAMGKSSAPKQTTKTAAGVSPSSSKKRSSDGTIRNPMRNNFQVVDKVSGTSTTYKPGERMSAADSATVRGVQSQIRANSVVKKSLPSLEKKKNKNNTGSLASSVENLADKTIKPVVQQYGRREGEKKAGPLKNIPFIGGGIKDAAGDAGARKAGKKYETAKERLKKGDFSGAIGVLGYKPPQ